MKVIDSFCFTKVFGKSNLNFRKSHVLAMKYGEYIEIMVQWDRNLKITEKLKAMN